VRIVSAKALLANTYLGVKKPVFKAHGNADAATFKSAIRLSIQYVERNVVGEISEALEKIKAEG